MKPKLAATFGVLCFFAGPGLSAEAQKGKLDLTQRFSVVDFTMTKQSELENKLNEAAAAGFRIVAGDLSSSAFAHNYLILEKVSEPPNTYQYRVLGFIENADKAVKLWNEAAAKGFRLMPRLWPEGVMEKGPAGEERYEYRILSTYRDSTLRKELADAVGEGFNILAVTTVMKGLWAHAAILERRAGMPPGPPAASEGILETASGQRYLWLVHAHGGFRFKKDLKGAAVAGYQRLIGHFPAASVLERLAEPASGHEFVLVDTNRAPTLEREMNQAGATGYRLLPGALIFFGTEIVAVMESTPGSKQRFEYVVLPMSHKTTQQDLVRLAGEGYRLIGMPQGRPDEVVLERGPK